MNPQTLLLLQQLSQNPQLMRTLIGTGVGNAAMSGIGNALEPNLPPASQAEQKAEERAQRRPTTRGERGKIRAQEGDQPERRRAAKINRGLASMLLAAPLALSGFALYKGGQSAADKMRRRIQSAEAADGMEPEEQEAGGVEEKKPSLIQKALEGISFNELNAFQKEKLKPLVSSLEKAQEQGKGLKDKNVRNLISNIRKIGKSSLAEQELGRLENEYPITKDIEVSEKEKISPTGRIKDTQKIEVGDLVETSEGKNGTVQSVDYDKGVAKIKIDKKVHNRKIDSLTQKDWNDLQSAVIEENYYSPDISASLIKFRKGPFYAYQDVSTDEYEKFSSGKATAKTTGEANGIKWWKGKNPSKGAAFWKYIRDKKPYSRLNEQVDINEFFGNFPAISPNLDWQIPQPKKKKRKKR